VSLSACEGRLTLVSGVSVQATDVVGATTVYFTPHRGSRICLYDGTKWVPYLLAELSSLVSGFAHVQTVTSTTTTSGSGVATMASTTGLYIGQPVSSPNVAASSTIVSVDSGTQITIGPVATATGTASANFYNANYDVFAYANAGAVALEFLGWTDNTTRAVALALQDGVSVKSGFATRRHLGVIRLTSTTTTESASNGSRFVLNANNQVPTKLVIAPGYLNDNLGTTYTTTSVTFAAANGGVGAYGKFLADGFQLSEFVLVAMATTTSQWFGGIGIDSATSAKSTCLSTSTTTYITGAASWKEILAAGYHYATLLVSTGVAGTATYFADVGRIGSTSDPYATYIICTIWM